jgi:hypothetical protein
MLVEDVTEADEFASLGVLQIAQECFRGGAQQDSL